MSRESLEQFYQRVLQDTALQEQLRSARDRASIISRAVELGQQNGFSFTREEVEEAIAQISQQRQDPAVDLGNIPERLGYAAS
jgi:predicted ribosomally synthesized peptide with nif11-like leader